MAKFTDYTEKTEPVDTDLALIYDTPAKANKKFTFGNLWKWIAKKIVSEGISQLETTNKTIPGAINELNSNSVKSKNNPSDLNSLISNGVYACGDIASIKNLPSSMTTSGILIVFSNKPYIGQIIFSHVFFYTRFSTSFGNEWYDWVKIK